MHWRIRKPFSGRPYLHVFFGIAQEWEGGVAVSVEQEGEATERFARAPIAAAAAPEAVAFAALPVDGVAAVGGGVAAHAEAGRNVEVAAAVSGFVCLP